ncbi:hypothetical protein [Lyngbya sp. CCY1209]|nr:hypothetical protein [Lyngbya sp. CCY1209]MEB3882325.1 hypothetical protein [Lyngbya sp. CCY1209]
MAIDGISAIETFFGLRFHVEVRSPRSHRSGDCQKKPNDLTLQINS